MSHGPLGEGSLRCASAFQHRDFAVSRIPLNFLEDTLDCRLRTFQNLREVAGVKEEGAGHVLTAVVGARCSKNLENFIVALFGFARDVILAAIDDLVEFAAHASPLLRILGLLSGGEKLRNDGGQLARWDRFAVVKTLDGMAAFRANLGEVFRSFHALGERRNPKAMPECGDSAHDRPVSGIALL